MELQEKILQGTHKVSEQAESPKQSNENKKYQT